MRALYTIGIYCLGLGIRIAALFSEKARAWVSGRVDVIEKVRNSVSPGEKWIWVHAASLGEFEQGRPLIERIKSDHPDIRVLLTFFSPSGYTVRKDYEHADLVTYMPLDTPRRAQRFVMAVRPVAAIFVKYEIWYYHLKALEDQNIATYLVCANLREGQIYFSLWGQFLGKRLNRFRQIFTQTSTSEKFLISRGFQNVTFAGDMRLDRVLEIAQNSGAFDWLRNIMIDRQILVAGSTWPEDEKRLIPAILRSDLPAIIAPHEIHQARVNDLLSKLPGAVRYSELRSKPREVKYIIVDTVGDLAYLYGLGAIAYVGGGFRQGLHNVLEPVAHRLPVIIGPEFADFAEAADLVSQGVIIPISSEDECADAMDMFLEHRTRAVVRTQIENYIRLNKGATDRIYRALREELTG